MGHFVNFDNIATNGSGAGTLDVTANGILALIDIVPADSVSFDIVISRMRPDGSLAAIYSATGVTADTVVEQVDMEQSGIPVVGPVRVVLANAGEHDDPVHVYLTVL